MLNLHFSPETGALATGSTSKKLFLDCSTIDPASSLEVGAAVAKSGEGDFSDMPVSVSSSTTFLNVGWRTRSNKRDIGIYVFFLEPQIPSSLKSYLSSLSWETKTVSSTPVHQVPDSAQN